MDEQEHLKERALNSIDRTIRANQAYQSVLLKALHTLHHRETLLNHSKKHLSSDTDSKEPPVLLDQLKNNPLLVYSDLITSPSSSSNSSSNPSTFLWNSTLAPSFPSQSVSFSFFKDEFGSILLPTIPISTPNWSMHPHLLRQPSEWTSQERSTLQRAIRNYFCFYLLKKGSLSLQTKITSHLDDFWPTIPETEIDWDHLSKAYFQSTKSPIDCKVQWLSWDHPAYLKETMLKEEIEAIIQARESSEFRNWIDLAKGLPKVRSPIMAFSAYNAHLRSRGALSGKNGRKWTPEENALLVRAAEVFGVNSWVQVAQVVGSRDAKQCLHHWRSLDPAIRSGCFSLEEDAALLDGVEKYGTKWALVSKCVLGRTDAQCRERYMNMQTLSLKLSPWSEEENQCILAFVTLHGMKWSQLADWLPGRSDRDVALQYRKLRNEIEQGEREGPLGGQVSLPLDQRSHNRWMKKFYPIDLEKSFNEVSSGLIPPNSASLHALEKLLCVVGVEEPETDELQVNEESQFDDPSELQKTLSISSSSSSLADSSTFTVSSSSLPLSSSSSSSSSFSSLSSNKSNPPSATSLNPDFFNIIVKHFFLSIFTGTVQSRPLGWKGVDHALQVREELANLVDEMYSSSTPSSSSSPQTET